MFRLHKTIRFKIMLTSSSTLRRQSVSILQLYRGVLSYPIAIILTFVSVAWLTTRTRIFNPGLESNIFTNTKIVLRPILKHRQLDFEQKRGRKSHRLPFYFLYESIFCRHEASCKNYTKKLFLQFLFRFHIYSFNLARVELGRLALCYHPSAVQCKVYNVHMYYTFFSFFCFITILLIWFVRFPCRDPLVCSTV